jgi:hypothetical protein
VLGADWDGMDEVDATAVIVRAYEVIAMDRSGERETGKVI